MLHIGDFHMRSWLLCCSLLLTTTLAHAVELKIAYVDLAQALNDVEDGKSAKARLKADFDAKQKKLDKMQNDFKVKKDDFDKKAGMMKPDVRMSKQEELQREFMEMQKTYSQLQQELIDRETQITNDIGQKLKTVIDKIGDREGYSMVLNIGETVLYYKRHQDITVQVVQEYNKQFSKK
jgi:outer membrane protein